jgi:hypothetical protein
MYMMQQMFAAQLTFRREQLEKKEESVHEKKE